MNLFQFSHFGALLVLAYSTIVVLHFIRFRLERRPKKGFKQRLGDKIASYAHLAVMIMFLILGAYSGLRLYRTEPIHVHFTIDFTI